MLKRILTTHGKLAVLGKCSFSLPNKYFIMETLGTSSAFHSKGDLIMLFSVAIFLQDSEMKVTEFLCN